MPLLLMPSCLHASFPKVCLQWQISLSQKNPSFFEKYNVIAQCLCEMSTITLWVFKTITPHTTRKQPSSTWCRFCHQRLVWSINMHIVFLFILGHLESQFSDSLDQFIYSKTSQIIKLWRHMRLTTRWFPTKMFPTRMCHWSCLRFSIAHNTFILFFFFFL